MAWTSGQHTIRISTPLHIAVLPGAVHHHCGQDGHDHTAKGTGQIDGVHEAHQAAICQRKGRQRHADQRNETGRDVILALKLEHIDDVGQHGATHSPIGAHHCAQRKNIGGIQGQVPSAGPMPG